MFRWFEYAQVYHPSRRFQSGPEILGRDWEEVHFQAADGVRLHGWFFPGPHHGKEQSRVILLCHGNGGNISHRMGYYEALWQAGLDVFAFDYRGYGKSEGRPSEQGTYQDAQAAYGWLKEKEYAPDQILLLGKSLGGAVAAELASRVPVGGLILQNTFTSVPELGAEFFPWLPVRWLCSIQYNTHAKLPRIQAPVLIMHSPDDLLIPIAHGRRNFTAANEPKIFFELTGDHNDALMAGEEAYLKGIRIFLEKLDAHSLKGTETGKISGTKH